MALGQFDNHLRAWIHGKSNEFSISTSRFSSDVKPPQFFEFGGGLTQNAAYSVKLVSLYNNYQTLSQRMVELARFDLKNIGSDYLKESWSFEFPGGWSTLDSNEPELEEGA